MEREEEKETEVGRGSADLFLLLLLLLLLLAPLLAAAVPPPLAELQGRLPRPRGEAKGAAAAAADAGAGAAVPLPAYNVARREAVPVVEERGVAPPATGTRSLPCMTSWGMEVAGCAAAEEVGAGAGLLAVWRLGEGSTLRLEVGEEEEVVVVALMGAAAALPS